MDREGSPAHALFCEVKELRAVSPHPGRPGHRLATYATRSSSCALLNCEVCPCSSSLAHVVSVSRSVAAHPSCRYGPRTESPRRDGGRNVPPVPTLASPVPLNCVPP